MKIFTALPAIIATVAALGADAANAPIEFTPGSNMRAYRQVLIAPARVEFDPGFLGEIKSLRGQAHRLSPAEVERLRHEMGESFHKALAEAFESRGFMIATAPGSQVLEITPALKDLYLNAPESARDPMVRSYAREAGRARMSVEGSDASGARVLVASEQATAGHALEFRPASGVSNRFWFDAMFRQWAGELAEAVAGAR
ncbi:MAG: hypothetical protein ABIR73_09945 [Usitatibacter sp.]